MNRKWIFISIIIIALVAIVGTYAWKEFTRMNTDLANVKPDVSVTAAQLIKEYADSDSAANKKYLGKVIAVSGTVDKIERDDEGYYTIVLGGNGDPSSIRCAIDSMHTKEAANIQARSSVTIKGIVTGYNKDDLGLGSDVELNRSVIQKSN